ncbi:M23 family metallopeptidase [Rathayibacter soli]|uniref:M23 family metallopeptidase n=1 Tax=Rathayibacter soli TaxID=3144168 RepID=UPI0027E4A567|nr:M23 family metallopeptidase [Glaciibacter superstes]
MIVSWRVPPACWARACLAAALAVLSATLQPVLPEVASGSASDTTASDALGTSPPTAAPPIVVTNAGAQALRAVAAPANVRWAWPIDPPHSILAGFQAPLTRYSAGHRGIDIASTPGALVRAPADATVYFSGAVVDRPVLTLQTAAGVLVSLEPVVGSVPLELPVRAGEVVGTVGSGGHCDRECVHLGVRVAGEYVSPLLFLGGAARAILLPLG